MNLVTGSIIFGVVVICLVLYVNQRKWNADELWERQSEHLRKQGIVAQRPSDWENQVERQRAQSIYAILVIVLIITVWFAWFIIRIR